MLPIRDPDSYQQIISGSSSAPMTTGKNGRKVDYLRQNGIGISCSA
jgi:hypothetical protein